MLLQGPRQCGKTTLARRLLEPRGYRYIDCGEHPTKQYAEQDIVGFVADLPERAILDEVQNVAHIFSQLRAGIDRRRVPGRFFLIGSSFVLSLPKLTDSLAGRVIFLRMHPLSRSEIAGNKSDFIAALFGKGFSTKWDHRRLGHGLCDMVFQGGYPSALALSKAFRKEKWHHGNLQSVFNRDLIELQRIDHPDILEKAMRYAAICTSGVQNINGLARTTEITMPTAKRYLSLLEHSFLLERLPSWQGNRLKRIVKAPKLHIGDTGMACALLPANAESLMADRSMYGKLLETFVYQELRKQADWQDFHVSMHYFRHKEKYEVDIVLEGTNGKVVGVEVKAGSSFGPEDFRGLKLLAEATGKKFVRGIVLYDGELCATLWKKYQAVPIRRLWEPE